jgi:hypothetical protein
MSHPVPTSYRVRTSFEAPASNVRSAGGIGGRSRQRHCFGFVFLIVRAVDQRVRGHWRRFVEARPAGEQPPADRGRCAHRGGSPPECAAALGLHPPANAGHELRSGADKTGTSTASERYRQIARRRDPPRCHDHRSAASRARLHQPGWPCSCVPPGTGAGSTTAPAGLRPLRVLRRALFENRALVATRRRTDADKPDSFGVVTSHRPPARGSFQLFISPRSGYATALRSNGAYSSGR